MTTFFRLSYGYLPNGRSQGQQSVYAVEIVASQAIPNILSCPKIQKADLATVSWVVFVVLIGAHVSQLSEFHH